MGSFEIHSLGVLAIEQLIVFKDLGLNLIKELDYKIAIFVIWFHVLDFIRYREVVELMMGMTPTHVPNP